MQKLPPHESFHIDSICMLTYIKKDKFWLEKAFHKYILDLFLFQMLPVRS